MAIPARQQLDGRLAGLREDRYSWWLSYREIATFMVPYRYRWLVTQNERNRGAIRTGSIIDSTGTIAARVLAAGMMSGITSPTRPWFKLRMEGFDRDSVTPVNLWLAECERRMMRVFQESNFYNCIAVVYMDLATFATAPMLIHEDYENVIDCSNPCAGEYYLGLGKNLRVEIFYREIVKTVWQLIDEFGEENVSTSVLNSYKQGGASLSLEIRICHAIEPNVGEGFEVPKHFAYREVYWEDGRTEDKFLRQRGYYEKPGIFPRWDVSGNDAYGVGPGWYALGDVKQLQQEQKRKAQAIDKLANPPMVADVELKNQPASTLPGGVTYITKKEGVGFKPAYENFRPPIQELMQDIAQVQERIQRVFFNDLFLMFQQLQAEPRSAAAIDARREEKLVMLGPVLERFQTEALDPVIDRVFGIMQRGGLLPPPPPELRQGAPIQVEYVSILATAQNAVNTAGIERLLGLVGNLVGVDRTVMDNINLDRTVIRYGSDLTVPPDLMNTDEERQTIRANRAQAEQQAQALQLADAAAKGAKTLSETEVGGGVNALQAMTGGGV